MHFLGCEESKDLYMIELQGTVTGPAFDGKPLGKLSFNSQGVPELAIGTRILEGKAEKLKLPIVATQRVSEDGKFAILGIVRQRLLFNSRPRIELPETDAAFGQFRA